MKTSVRILIALGLVLPLGAYVAGSLAAVGVDDSRPRDTIVIRDSAHDSPSPVDGTGRPRPSAGHDAGDDHGGIQVIVPTPDTLDDHGGDRGDNHGGDHGGHGSDDSGGHGGGHG